MTRHSRRAAAVLAAALTSGLLLGSAGCAASGAEPETGGGRVTAPSVGTSVSPTPRPTGAVPASPGPITAHPAELPTAVVEGPEPSRLVVSKARLDLPIAAMGVATDGQMALPPDPRTIGWYRFGPRPADRAGSVVLGGHLDSREYGVGPLIRLRKIRRGDLVEVRQTDGSTTRYRVTRVRDVPKKRLAADDLFDRTGSPRLQIVTCGGPYNPDAGGYRDNLIVTAEPAR